MKLKVKVIAVNLKRNRVAKFDEVIDSDQLPVPEQAEEMCRQGYFDKVSDEDANTSGSGSAVAFQELTEEQVQALKDELSEKKKDELLAFAEENSIEVNPRDNKSTVREAVLLAIDARRAESEKGNSEEEE